MQTKLKEHVSKIATMSEDELTNFSIDISMSDLEREQKKYLYSAIEERYAALKKRQSCSVECSSFED